MARRYYSSIAARTTLASGVDNATTTLSVVAVSGWPSSFPYTLIIDQDTINEEVVEVTARTGTTLTVTRGVDGTTAVAHSAGAAVNHGVSARDFDEPNAFLNSGTLPLATAKGDLIAATGNGAVDNLPVGTNGYVLRADSTETMGLEWYDIATDLGLKFDKRPDQNLQTGASYTFVAGDVGKLVTASSSGSAVYTIPAASSVAWEDDTVLRLVNIGPGAVSFAAAAGVTLDNSDVEIDQFEGATLIRTASNSWVAVPFGAGGSALAGAAIADTPTGNYTSGGITYDYWEFNSSSSINVTTAGLADVLIVGGGGGGGGNNSQGNAGGGGGGGVTSGSVYLPTGTHAVIVGAGGAGGSAVGSSGGPSSVYAIFGPGGGGGGAGGTVGADGGSGGGGGDSGNRAGGSALYTSPVNGFNGGSGSSSGDRIAGGGGGGGEAGNTDGQGYGGDGFTTSITNTSATYAGGGGGGKNNSAVSNGGTGGGGNGGNISVTSTNGTANTGGGGGGAGNFAFVGGGAGSSGGSGIVIVRIQI